MFTEEHRKNIGLAKKGTVMSEEARANISKAKKGVKQTPEAIAIRAKAHIGLHHSEETKRKIGNAHKGRRLTDEHKRNISITHKGNPLLAKPKSEEHKRKIGEAHKGKPKSEETKQKLRIANTGKTMSPESRKKISDAQIGEKSPHWKGGISFEPYCVKFNKQFKERVRAFFGYKCVECEAPQNGIKLHVHHVNFNKNTCCDDSIPLFVPLCRSCHSKTGFNREYWQRHFTDIINTYYGGKCYLTQEESVVWAIV